MADPDRLPTMSECNRAVRSFSAGKPRILAAVNTAVIWQLSSNPRVIRLGDRGYNDRKAASVTPAGQTGKRHSGRSTKDRLAGTGASDKTS